jgi:hypothetical protein
MDDRETGQDQKKYQTGDRGDYRPLPGDGSELLRYPIGDKDVPSGISGGKYNLSSGGSW